jgi:TolB protein
MTIRLPRLNAFILCAPALLLAGQAQAQDASPTATVIAVPPLATVKNVDTEAGKTWALANQISDLISADLKSTGKFIVADVSKVRIPSYPEVTAPAYPAWRSAGAKLLLSGFVNSRDDGRLTIGCYVYDVQAGREVARQGFAVAPAEWRRAAHRCADEAYEKATGNTPPFDSRIAYVAQSGAGDSLVKRVAVMDFDGANHAFVTAGDSTVLTPSLAPGADRIAYTSFAGGHLHVRVTDPDSQQDRPLLAIPDDNFAPAFSADGRTIALSIAQAGNVDVFAVDSAGGSPHRLTASPAIDTSPAFSPDGKLIAFVSDRSGSPQLYVMNADGSAQHRVSFGPGEYGSPAWSADGERIAFSRVEGTVSRIGNMSADGSDEHILTAGPDDEQPSWSPDGGMILFEHEDPGTRREQLATVPMAGGQIRVVPTPQGASDPSWVGRQEQ